MLPALAFRAVQYTHIIDPAINDGYGLMAAEAAGLRPSLVTAVYARLLAARQEADGHWETGDERPPESYSPFTATALASCVRGRRFCLIPRTRPKSARGKSSASASPVETTRMRTGWPEN